MKTPYLDTLLAQATQGSSLNRARLDAEMKLSLLFEGHGPATVEFIKDLSNEVVYDAFGHRWIPSMHAKEAIVLLTTLDQEAQGS